MSGLTEMLKRYGWQVPAEAQVLGAAGCRRCHREVLWIKEKGKKRPLNRNGSIHTMDCIGR